KSVFGLTAERVVCALDALERSRGVGGRACANLVRRGDIGGPLSQQRPPNDPREPPVQRGDGCAPPGNGSVDFVPALRGALPPRVWVAWDPVGQRALYTVIRRRIVRAEGKPRVNEVRSVRRKGAWRER